MEVRTKMITLDAGQTVPLSKNWFAETMANVVPAQDPIYAASGCARAGAGDNCWSCKFQKANGSC